MLIQVPRASIARIQEKSVVIAATNKFGPRKIGLNVDICRRQAGQNSTCNTRRSEVLYVGSHILPSNPSSVRVNLQSLGDTGKKVIF